MGETMVSLLQIGISNACLATAFAVVAVVVTRFFRNRRLAFLIWLLVLVKLVTPPLWTIPLSFEKSEFGASVAQQLVPSTDTAGGFSGEPLPLRPNDPTETWAGEPNVRQPVPIATIKSRSTSWNVGNMVAWAWLVSSLAFATVVLLRVRRFQRTLAHAGASSPKLASRVDRLRLQLGLKRGVDVKILNGSLPPMIWPLARTPVMLLPRRLVDELDASQLDTVIVHELAHLRRRDDMVAIFEALVTSFFWWHPVVWLARQQMRMAAEDCCDAMVVGALPKSRRQYGEALLRSAVLASGQTSIPLFATTLARHRPLKERIEMVLHARFHGPLSIRVKCLCLALAVGLLPLAATATLQSDETPEDLSPKFEQILFSQDSPAGESEGAEGEQDQGTDAPRPASRHFEIWAMDAHGKDARRIAHVPDYPIINSPEISPDGNFVAVDGWKKGERLQNARVLIVDIRTGEVNNWAQGAMPTWSPDGKWIAFCKYGAERGVYIRSLDGKTERLLDREGWGIQWSPDGLKAAYGRRGRLVVHNFVSDSEREVVPEDWDYTSIYWNPTWSSDSKQICFKARHKDGHSEFAIVNIVSNMATVRRRVNADDFNEDIAWHADGTRILVPRRPIDGGRAQLCEFDPTQDGKPVPVVGQPTDRNQAGMCWSRDGKTLFFISRK